MGPLARLLLAGFLAVGPSSLVAAQIGPDDVILSSIRSFQTQQVGPAGLWIVDSTNGAVTPVTGLGPDLTGAGASGGVGAGPGASSVLVGPSGELYVGEWVGPNSRLDVHVITLNGTAVATDTRIPVATTRQGGAIGQMALLPSGEIVFAVRMILGTGPVARADVGMIDPATGQVTQLAMTSQLIPGARALCLDASCQRAYYSALRADSRTDILSIPVPGGGTPTLHATVCGSVNSLHLDAVRNRLIGTVNGLGCFEQILAFDLSDFSVERCAHGELAAFLAAPDGAGGLFLATSSPGIRIRRTGVPPSCATTIVASTPPGGWGALTGMDTLYRASCSPWQIGERYCGPSAPNSTGASSRISGFGRTSTAANDVVVRAAQLPPSAAGYLLVSDTRDLVASPGGSVGNLCLGGAIGRYVGPGQVMSSGPNGTFELRLDLATIPRPTGAVSTVPGTTWNFSWWHRDTGSGGAATSNFTDALAVRFD